MSLRVQYVAYDGRVAIAVVPRIRMLFRRHVVVDRRHRILRDGSLTDVQLGEIGEYHELVVKFRASQTLADSGPTAMPALIAVANGATPAGSSGAKRKRARSSTASSTSSSSAAASAAAAALRVPTGDTSEEGADDESDDDDGGGYR